MYIFVFTNCEMRGYDGAALRSCPAFNLITHVHPERMGTARSLIAPCMNTGFSTLPLNLLTRIKKSGWVSFNIRVTIYWLLCRFNRVCIHINCMDEYLHLQRCEWHSITMAHSAYNCHKSDRAACELDALLL